MGFAITSPLTTLQCELETHAALVEALEPTACSQSVLLKSFNHDNHCFILADAEGMATESRVPCAGSSLDPVFGLLSRQSAQLLAHGYFIPKVHGGKKHAFARSLMVELKEALFVHTA